MTNRKWEVAPISLSLRRFCPYLSTVFANSKNQWEFELQEFWWRRGREHGGYKRTHVQTWCWSRPRRYRVWRTCRTPHAEQSWPPWFWTALARGWCNTRQETKTRCPTKEGLSGSTRVLTGIYIQLSSNFKSIVLSWKYFPLKFKPVQVCE